LGILENVLWRNLEQPREVIHWRAGKNYILSNFRMHATYKILPEFSNQGGPDGWDM
jgi:hypothetical protein